MIDIFRDPIKCSFALGRGKYCTMDIRIPHEHCHPINGVLQAIPLKGGKR